MPTYRLLIEYDGSRFSGWQIQPRGRTVQGVLLERLRALTGETAIDLQGAGRTDAGVHALGQVASLRCRRPQRPTVLLRELEHALPGDVAVLELQEARRGFHARHDAVARSYRYQIARHRSAFGKTTTWWVRQPLDVDAMRRAGGVFVGRHDFAPFARRAKEAESTIVVVNDCTVAEVGGYVLIRLIASHFLWNQVRRMVASLVAIGTGQAAAGDVARWLAGELDPPAEAAPAAGLFLEAVHYPEEKQGLPALLPIGVPYRDSGE